MPLVPIHCPSCAAELDLDEQYRDWTVRCPECRHEFVPPAPRPPRPAPEPRPRPPGNPAEDCNSAGVGLTVVALIQLCVCAFVVFFNALVRPNVRPPMNPNPQEEAEEILLLVVAGSVGLIQAALMILGAIALKNRRRYALAMTGAAAAVVPCNVCCFTAVPFGVWALVVLARPGTKELFAANADPPYPE